MDETDERIQAWDAVASHPFFKEAYREEAPLIVSMLKQLDGLMTKREVVATRAEEPAEWRVLRAFSNGYAEGLRRGHEGGLDR